MKIIIEAENLEELKSLLEKLTQKTLSGGCTSIRKLHITVRSLNCLLAEGIETVEQVATKSITELMKIPNLGRKGANEILEALKAE